MADTPAMWLWWRAYLAVSAVAGAFVILVPGVVADGVCVVATAVSGTVLVVGVLVNRPDVTRPWWCVAAGMWLWALGDITYAVLVTRGLEPFPSVADVFYLLAYPLIAWGLGLLVLQRRSHRGVDAAAAIDSAIVTVGLGLLSWVFLTRPVLEDTAEPLLSRLVGAAYPVGDVLLLAMLVRLVVAPGARNGAFRLLTAAVTTMLVVDTAWAVVAIVYDTGSPVLNAAWLMSYALFAAAAVHPSMRALGAPADPTTSPFTRRRLVTLTAAVLTAPVILAVQLVRHDLDVMAETGVVLAGCVVMFLLVVLRMHLAIQAMARSTRQRDRLRADLAHQAAHDALTELTNRARTLELVAAALDRGATDGSAVGLMFVDLDHFKAVNDAHGHAVGDLVLQHAARRLRSLVRVGDVVGRLGGDEFVVLLQRSPGARELLGLAQDVAAALAVPVTISGHPVAIGASVGVALSGPGERDAADLVHHADVAAYRAKSDGRGRAVLFDDALRAQLREQELVEDELRAAIRGDQLVLHYQPVVALSTGAVAAVEALVRWRRPDGTLIAPDAFIPVAEKSDLICDLGRWVLREATRQLARWSVEHPAELGQTSVAVNISGRHLGRPEVVDDVRSALMVSGLPAHRLVLEITETVLVDEPTWRRQLDRLRRLGVGVSIDDFGTGYTSIGQLQQLQADAVKIDRSFVQSPEAGTRDLVLLMIGAAHAFGLRVVAEGVEEQRHADDLRVMGCDFAQGFHIARPAAAADIVAALLTGPLLPPLEPAAAGAASAAAPLQPAHPSPVPGLQPSPVPGLQPSPLPARQPGVPLPPPPRREPTGVH